MWENNGFKFGVEETQLTIKLNYATFYFLAIYKVKGKKR